ncbi:MAG: 50S ribosomal protein L3 [Myxococcota bacterium]|nr:50S ribosomal protein L3 [Myxococcota bacterium]
MNSGILGKKLGMTQVFSPAGQLIGVTAVEVGPCVVIQKRTADKDGYSAVQIGFEDKADRKVNKPMMGHFSKAGVKAKRFLREFRMSAEQVNEISVGQEINIADLKAGDIVDVIGISRGMGFAGVMKRYNFSGAKATHGVHEYFRHGGSLGTNMTPGRVFKNRKMPGHMGAERVTMQNVEVVRVFAQDNIVYLRGPIPGAKNSLVTLRPAVKG